MPDKTISQFYFGETEHPNRQKFNDFMATIEGTRRFVGEISLAACTGGTNTASGYYVKLNESPYNLGGVRYDSTITGWVTRSYFWCQYDGNSYPIATGAFDNSAAWRIVQFISGGNFSPGDAWYTHLTESGVMDHGSHYYGNLGTGASEVNLSGVTITGFRCVNMGPFHDS
jgi:hypothetical protein